MKSKEIKRLFSIVNKCLRELGHMGGTQNKINDFHADRLNKLEGKIRRIGMEPMTKDPDALLSKVTHDGKGTYTVSIDNPMLDEKDEVEIKLSDIPESTSLKEVNELGLGPNESIGYPYRDEKIHDPKCKRYKLLKVAPGDPYGGYYNPSCTCDELNKEPCKHVFNLQNRDEKVVKHCCRCGKEEDFIKSEQDKVMEKAAEDVEKALADIEIPEGTKKIEHLLADEIIRFRKVKTEDRRP